MKYEVTVMLFLLVSVFFALELNRSNSPFSFEKNKTLGQVKIKPKISKHGQVKSNVVKTSAGASAGDKQCSRKDHVVYIKTHKTGSTTAAGVFWRYALRRNLSVVSFEFVWPQKESFIHHMLDSHPSLHKLSHFDMVLEHLVYNKKEFQNVMPKDTVYITSIREPVAQFKSGVNFLRIPMQFNITSSDPASELLQHLDTYLHRQNSEILKARRNPNAHDLGLPEKDFENETEVNEFIASTVHDFQHVLITEYLDESLIVMRRKLCWDFSDILYLPLRVKQYNYKRKPLKPELQEKLTNWNRVDTMLYKTFNETLWRNIAQHGKDFWNELNFYKKQKERILKFCSYEMHSLLRNWNISKLANSIEIPPSSWGNSFKIDSVWCLVSRIDEKVMRNILRVKNYPELCDQIIPTDDVIHFHKTRKDMKARLHPSYCSRHVTSRNQTFQMSLPLLRMTDSYIFY